MDKERIHVAKRLCAGNLYCRNNQKAPLLTLLNSQIDRQIVILELNALALMYSNMLRHRNHIQSVVPSLTHTACRREVGICKDGMQMKIALECLIPLYIGYLDNGTNTLLKLIAKYSIVRVLRRSLCSGSCSYCN